MTEESSTEGKGKAFFARAEQVAEMGSWDFAIEMYLEGIQRDPGNIAQGHQPLREVSLKRKATGGKHAGMMEQLKRRTGKDLLHNLLNTEYMLAKEPGSIPHMVAFLKAAQTMKLVPVIKWICAILVESQRQASKPDKRILTLVTDAYVGIEDFIPAAQAADLAVKHFPDDEILKDRLRTLSAQATIQRGKYDEEGDFTKSVRDLDKQKQAVQAEGITQTRQFQDQQIERARKDYLGSPTVVGKINAFVDALLKPEQEALENEAIDVLNMAFNDSKMYAHKARIGDIRMKQMTRRFRKLVAAGDKAAAAEQAQRQLAYELEQFLERAVNYPTDLTVKFELGRRQFLAGQFDEAIASLQQAQRDPRRHLRALTYIGQAFEKKKWYREAVETYEKALAVEMPEDTAKEVRYQYGSVLEKLGDIRPSTAEKLADYERAREQLSQVAMIDYNFKDVRDRVDAIRKKIDQTRTAG